MNTPMMKQPKAAEFVCRKCRHTECARQMRHVAVAVGSTAHIMRTVAPCRMCTKCGDLTVALNADIADLVDYVPAEGFGQPATTVEENSKTVADALNDAIAATESSKPVTKSPTDKKKRKK